MVVEDTFAIPEQVLKDLSGKSIAIIGMGYVGRQLKRYFESAPQPNNFNLSVFSRKNIDEIKGQSFDLVFNCAGNTGDFRKKILETIDSNLVLTNFILQNVKINMAYVGLSSTRIYGFAAEVDIVFDEESVIDSNNNNHLDINFIYDGTKKLLESALWNLRDAVPYKIILCRLSNLYGRYTKNDLDDSTFLKLMLRYMVERKPVVINQNINSNKGYVFIDDAIDGIVRSALYSAGSDIYNICSGESYSIADWLGKLDIEYDVSIPQPQPSYSNISIKKAQKAFDFKPQYFLNKINTKNIYTNGPHQTI